jgi:hypothetical protein
MNTSPQIIEMLNELQRDELARVSVHRIDAMTSRAGVRSTVASALVRAGMTLDRNAAALTADARSSDRVNRPHPATGDAALHW